MAECMRCGGCCKATPCYLAQVWYGITKENQIVCPDLEREIDGSYTCLMMRKSEWARRELLGTGCHYPEYRAINTKNLALEVRGNEL